MIKLLKKISFDSKKTGELFRRYLPQLDYYRGKKKEVIRKLGSGWMLTEKFGETDDQQQTANEGPLKRSISSAQRRVTLEQITAYKVACEYLKRDQSWKSDWGITVQNTNKDGKKLITLGGMYPIVSNTYPLVFPAKPPIC